MSSSRVLKCVIGLAIAMMVVTGCSGPSGEPTVTPTPIPPSATPVPPTATATSIRPTATATPVPTAAGETVFDGNVVTFDGSECIVSGPTELPTGDHSFLLKDLTDKRVSLWVSRLIDGKTYQDLVDEQTEPGVWWPKPDWVKYTDEVGRDYPEGGRAWTYRLDSEGEHFIYVGNYDPPTLWLCGPLQVKEAPG